MRYDLKTNLKLKDFKDLKFIRVCINNNNNDIYIYP